MYQIAKEIYIPFSLTYYHLSSLYMFLNICICHLCTNVSMFLSIQFSIFPLIYHAIYHWHIYACIFIMYLVILLKKESKSAMYQPLCQEEKCRHQNIQISDGGGLTLIIPEVHLLWNEDGSSTELAGTQLLTVHVFLPTSHLLCFLPIEQRSQPQLFLDVSHKYFQMILQLTLQIIHYKTAYQQV